MGCPKIDKIVHKISMIQNIPLIYIPTTKGGLEELLSMINDIIFQSSGSRTIQKPLQRIMDTLSEITGGDERIGAEEGLSEEFVRKVASQIGNLTETQINQNTNNADLLTLEQVIDLKRSKAPKTQQELRLLYDYKKTITSTMMDGQTTQWMQDYYATCMYFLTNFQRVFEHLRRKNSETFQFKTVMMGSSIQRSNLVSRGVKKALSCYNYSDVDVKVHIKVREDLSPSRIGGKLIKTIMKYHISDILGKYSILPHKVDGGVHVNGDGDTFQFDGTQKGISSSATIYRRQERIPDMFPKIYKLPNSDFSVTVLWFSDAPDDQHPDTHMQAVLRIFRNVLSTTPTGRETNMRMEYLDIGFTTMDPKNDVDNETLYRRKHVVEAGKLLQDQCLVPQGPQEIPEALAHKCMQRETEITKLIMQNSIANVQAQMF